MSALGASDRGPGRVTIMIMAVPLPVDSGIKIIIAWRDQCRCRHWQCGGALAEGPSSETPSLAIGGGRLRVMRPSGPRVPRRLLVLYLMSATRIRVAPAPGAPSSTRALARTGSPGPS